jgi:LPS sulfotransferase NodH
MLLAAMPLKHNYKVIFMARPVEEVVASQRKMIERLGSKGAALDLEELKRGLTAHRDEMRHWLRNVPHMEFVEVDYPALVRQPDATIARIVEFLGEDHLPAREKMKSAIDPSLHRKKSESIRQD